MKNSAFLIHVNSCSSTYSNTNNCRFETDRAYNCKGVLDQKCRILPCDHWTFNF